MMISFWLLQIKPIADEIATESVDVTTTLLMKLQQMLLVMSQYTSMMKLSMLKVSLLKIVTLLRLL